jgi:hypothetical protein
LEKCVGSRVHLVGVSISIEKNFYRLPFTPPSLVRRIGPSASHEVIKEKGEEEAPPYQGSSSTDLQTQRSSTPIVLQLCPNPRKQNLQQHKQNPGSAINNNKPSPQVEQGPLNFLGNTSI